MKEKRKMTTKRAPFMNPSLQKREHNTRAKEREWEWEEGRGALMDQQWVIFAKSMEGLYEAKARRKRKGAAVGCWGDGMKGKGRSQRQAEKFMRHTVRFNMT